MITDEGIEISAGEIVGNAVLGVFQLYKDMLKELKEEYNNLPEELISGATNKIAVLDALKEYKSKVVAKGDELLSQDPNLQSFSEFIDVYYMAIDQYISSGEGSSDDEFTEPTKKEEIVGIFKQFEVDIVGVETMVKGQFE